MRLFIVIFIFLAVITFLFVATPLGMTFKTLSFLFSILPIEATELSEDVIQEIYPKDKDSTFYIFRPADDNRHPGVVISLGIHPQGAEEKNLQKLFQGLVQNGVVVITVDSSALKDSLIDKKEIKNLVEAFQFLEKKPYIDSSTIGFFGLSVGSSLAFLAAADPEIQEKVKYILWSGGYFDAKQLIQEVLSESFVYQEKVNSWDPSLRIKEVVEKNLQRFFEEEKTLEGKIIIEKIMESKQREELEKLFRDLPPYTNEILESLSPKTVVPEVKASLFILHGKKDQLIPFPHSLFLSEIYSGKKTVVISEKYGHVSPERPSLKDLFSKDFWQVIYFSNKLFAEIF